MNESKIWLFAPRHSSGEERFSLRNQPADVAIADFSQFPNINEKSLNFFQLEIFSWMEDQWKNDWSFYHSYPMILLSMKRWLIILSSIHEKNFRVQKNLQQSWKLFQTDREFIKRQAIFWILVRKKLWKNINGKSTNFSC